MESKVALRIKEAPLISIPQSPQSPQQPQTTQIPHYIEAYAKFICSKRGKFTAIFSMIILYIISYTGVATMKSTFEPSKAFPSDSPLANSMDSIRFVELFKHI